MRVKLLGRWWGLRFVPNLRDDGACDPPTLKGKEIRVKSTLTGVDRLETVIHEMVHAAGWHLDEPFTEQFAHDAARVLWRLGYRLDTQVKM
jgi:hypothetical protein